MKIKIISIIVVIITLMTIGCNYFTYSEKVEDEIKKVFKNTSRKGRLIINVNED